MSDFKTIANFRIDNRKEVRSVCRRFTVLCQRLVNAWIDVNSLGPMAAPIIASTRSLVGTLTESFRGLGEVK